MNGNVNAPHFVGPGTRAPVCPTVSAGAALAVLVVLESVFPPVAWADSQPGSLPSPATVQAASVQNELLGDQMLVRELMRLDAEQAALRLRKGTSSAAGGTVMTPTPQLRGDSGQLRPKLQAIYGVGQRLLAEVSWQGQSYIYLKGQALPAGRKADASTLRLKSISARCIALQGPDRLFESCLGSAGHEGVR